MVAEAVPDQFPPYRFKTKPYKHQLEGLQLALKYRSYGLLFDPGTGKSKVAVDYAGVLTQRGLLKAVLIVGPIAVEGVWVGDEDRQGGEIRKHFPQGYRRRIINLSGIGSKKVKETLAKVRYIDGVTDWYFIN